MNSVYGYPWGTATYCSPGPAGPLGRTYRTSYDPDYIAGMIHTAAIQYDVRGVGNVAGAHASRPAQWRPLPGFESVRCRLVIRRDNVLDGDLRPGATRLARVLFAQDVPADQRYSLLFPEPLYGTLRFYFLGAVVDAHGMGHHWFADVQDCPVVLSN